MAKQMEKQQTLEGALTVMQAHSITGALKMQDIFYEHDELDLYKEVQIERMAKTDNLRIRPVPANVEKEHKMTWIYHDLFMDPKDQSFSNSEEENHTGLENLAEELDKNEPGGSGQIIESPPDKKSKLSMEEKMETPMRFFSARSLLGYKHVHSDSD